MTGLVKRSLSLNRHRTSIALEAEFWAALERIAEREGVSLAALAARVDAARAPDQGLASALRLLALADGR